MDARSPREQDTFQEELTPEDLKDREINILQEALFKKQLIIDTLVGFDKTESST